MQPAPPAPSWPRVLVGGALVRLVDDGARWMFLHAQGTHRAVFGLFLLLGGTLGLPGAWSALDGDVTKGVLLLVLTTLAVLAGIALLRHASVVSRRSSLLLVLDFPAGVLRGGTGVVLAPLSQVQFDLVRQILEPQRGCALRCRWGPRGSMELALWGPAAVRALTILRERGLNVVG